MKKIFILTVWCAMCFVLNAGCASIIKSGGSQAINFKSEPAGAKCAIFDNVTGDNIANVITPNIIQLKKSNGYFKYAKYTVVCSCDNNISQAGNIEGYVNGWYIGGNILAGGLIGYLIVDPATGSMWSLEPEVFVANFVDPGKSILTRVVVTDNAASVVEE